MLKWLISKFKRNKTTHYTSVQDIEMSCTVVEYFGNDDDNGNECGYCKNGYGNLAYGMWAHMLTCQDYQDLLDRGWRRSGKYCYKPIMDKTCCPQYTIRLDVTGTKLRKSHKKCIKSFNKYITNGVKPKNSDNHCKEGEMKGEFVSHQAFEMPERLPDRKCDISSDKSISKQDISSSIKGADPNLPKCQKAKEIRLENKKRKFEQKDPTEQSQCKNSTSNKNREKSLEEWIEDIPKDSKIRLKIKTVRCCPESHDFKATFSKEYEVYKKYQVTIHNDEPSEVDERQFRRFLCEGPLIPVNWKDEIKFQTSRIGFGAFHQQYYFDDRLVAVGVLDILPNCVSSKYFFYDPEFMFLSFGTYSALSEIYFIRSLQREIEELKYYYMGFYIQSCQKMKYKGKFYPSYLLCPETFNWIPIENCVEKLDVSKYARLEDDESIVAKTWNSDETLVIYESKYMTFKLFDGIHLKNPAEKRQNKKTVEEYTQLVGKCSQSMLLYRS